jgi:hypothetical protein
MKKKMKGIRRCFIIYKCIKIFIAHECLFIKCLLFFKNKHLCILQWKREDKRLFNDSHQWYCLMDDDESLVEIESVEMELV